MKLLEGISKVLVDEDVGGKILDKIREILEQSNIEVTEITKEQRELRGKDDKFIVEWAKNNGFDAILTGDYGMMREAIQRKLNVLLLLAYEAHNINILTRIIPIKGWRIEIEEFDF